MESGSIRQRDHRLCLRPVWTERWSPKTYPVEILCLLSIHSLGMYNLSKESLITQKTTIVQL